MIIAIPASGEKTDALMDERFGRCSFFCFYDTDTKKTEFRENIHKDASEGVGPQVAEFLAKNGINEVFAAEVGPKALNILVKLNIKTTIISTGKNIQQVINTLNNK